MGQRCFQQPIPFFCRAAPASDPAGPSTIRWIAYLSFSAMIQPDFLPPDFGLSNHHVEFSS
jgi:hypothetical protein